jgi:hypothetical protein
MTGWSVARRVSWARAPSNDDPRCQPEVVSESVPHTSTLPVIVPPSSDIRSDRRGSAS